MDFSKKSASISRRQSTGNFHEKNSGFCPSPEQAEIGGFAADGETAGLPLLKERFRQYPEKRVP